MSRWSANINYEAPRTTIPTNSLSDFHRPGRGCQHFETWLNTLKFQKQKWCRVLMIFGDLAPNVARKQWAIKGLFLLSTFPWKVFNKICCLGRFHKTRVFSCKFWRLNLVSFLRSLSSVRGRFPKSLSPKMYVITRSQPQLFRQWGYNYLGVRQNLLIIFISVAQKTLRISSVRNSCF